MSFEAHAGVSSTTINANARLGGLASKAETGVG
jgi:hypothetical protein